MFIVCDVYHADIAQLVEQRIRNAKVVGSTPIIGTIFNNINCTLIYLTLISI